MSATNLIICAILFFYYVIIRHPERVFVVLLVEMFQTVQSRYKIVNEPGAFLSDCGFIGTEQWLLCVSCHSEKTICGLCEIFAFIGYSHSENEPMTSKWNNSRGWIGWTVRHRLKVYTNIYKFKSLTNQHVTDWSPPTTTSWQWPRPSLSWVHLEVSSC